MRNRYFFVADLLLILCSAVAAFALRFDLSLLRNRTEAWAFLAAVLIVKPLVFLWFGVYKRYWPAASTGEFMILVGANALNAFVLGLLVSVGLLFQIVGEFSRSVLLIDFLLAVVLTGGIRLMVRVITDSARRTRKADEGRGLQPRRVLIVGAGEAGVLVARESQRNPQLGLDIVG